MNVKIKEGMESLAGAPENFINFMFQVNLSPATNMTMKEGTASWGRGPQNFFKISRNRPPGTDWQ